MLQWCDKCNGMFIWYLKDMLPANHIILPNVVEGKNLDLVVQQMVI